ncbi:MAG TPA: glycogen debranching protein GlgX [Candidatus Obscuribacterales bacterium]
MAITEQSQSTWTTLRISEGKPYPLGATWDGLGTNFALFSEHGTKVELCLFDSAQATQESHRIELPQRTAFVWHAYIRDIKPGQVYGYRVHGPYDPANGLRFNPSKLLTDPYAKAIVRGVTWHDSLFGYKIADKQSDLSKDERDSAPYAPLCAVVDPSFVWGNDTRPDVPWNKTVIYEAHVKGLTKLHPDIPPHLRGTYSAVASDPIIRHLTKLGVTAIELMPVHHRVTNRVLEDKNLSDYWGYNTLSYFAPDHRFASTKNPLDHTQEFKMMVRALHAAGIEVILDVVYNHTVEGSHLGPTLCFRGIDNTSYYRTVPEKERYYMDYTGCGNTLNMTHPRVLQLIMDSLRYWVEEMHVDGFRFDLASALARELFDVDHLSAFFDVIQQDPVISQVKLIAEPWDVGEGGYQVGNFPVLWTEWNGKYRDTIRRFVKGDSGVLGEMATRLTGSSDLYERTGRRPHASINFVTSHDGFTLSDLVSYNEKHNLDNGEENQDGDNHNNSWNCGVEGIPADAKVTKLRYQQKRNFMALLMLSIGVPMISGGDELGRTQMGNNNAYAQDNEISWYNWDLSPDDEKFLEFVQRVAAIRKRQPVIHRKDFFRGTKLGDGTYLNEVYWLRPDGKFMQESDWADSEAKSFGLLIEGSGLEEEDTHTGLRLKGSTLLLICNASHVDVVYKLPKHKDHEHWELAIETVEGNSASCWKASQQFTAWARSVALFVSRSAEEAAAMI